MSGNQSHADRVNPPTTFHAGPGMSVRVRPASDKKTNTRSLLST